MGNEFDEKARSWDEDPSRVERAHSIGDKIEQMVDFSKVRSALEYGAGTGLLGLRLLPNLESLWLVDASEEMIQVTAEKLKELNLQNVKAKRADFLIDPLPDEKFDMVLILMTLHHINDVAGILKSFNKVLNEHGFLVVADLEKEDGSFHDGEFHGHHGFARSELEGYLIDQGFKPQQWEIGYRVKKNDGREYPVFISVSMKGKDL